MSCASSMLAMIFSSPPQRVQLSISKPNTRLSRRAQLIATRHRRPMLTVRGKHAVIAPQVHSRRGHQRREARHRIQRFEHDVGGASR
jgi:hypothetical protein